MNKECIYIDDKVIVKDDKGKLTVPSYNCDNMEEILMQENILETLNNKKIELNKEETKIKENNKKFIPQYTLMSIIIIIPFMFIAYLSLNSNIDFKNFAICVSPILALPGVAFDIDAYKNLKILKNKLKGIKTELDYVNKQYEIEKAKLSELKKQKNNNDVEIKIVELNDKEKLMNYKHILELYYEFGYKEEEYYNYYLNGNLEDKLKRYYESRDIELAKSYFEEKDLILKRSKK